MSTNLIRLTSLPEGLIALAEVARAEGYFMLDRLIDGFESGSNAFDSPGEALFGVQRAGTLVGIGGLNSDPYFEDPSIGRVRHLYIHPRARRSGVGCMITRAIERHARGHFCRLQLFTCGGGAKGQPCKAPRCGPRRPSQSPSRRAHITTMMKPRHMLQSCIGIGVVGSSRYTREPDEVEKAPGGTEQWIYKSDLRWGGVVIPIPLMVPVGRESTSFCIRDGVVVGADRMAETTTLYIAGVYHR